MLIRIDNQNRRKDVRQGPLLFAITRIIAPANMKAKATVEDSTLDGTVQHIRRVRDGGTSDPI